MILTKCGMEMPGQGKGLSPDWISTAVEASLSRLGVERIDFYQAHKDDETVPLEETLGAFAKLIDEGKVGAIGASNYTAPRLKAALEASAPQRPAALREPPAAPQPAGARHRVRPAAALPGARAWASSPTTPSPPAS